MKRPEHHDWYMAKVVYTVWDIYHIKYVILRQLRQPMRFVLTALLVKYWIEGPKRGPLLFITDHIRVTFKIKWIRL
jgi:hypothetical protein